LLRRHNHAEALHVLQGMNKSCENHPVLLYTLGLIQNALDNHTEALKHFDQALELAPGFKKVNLQKAIIYLKRNEFAQAVKCLEREIENSGEIIPALITLGEIRVKQKDFKLAIHYFQEVLTADPGNAAARNYLKSITEATNSL